LAIPPWTRNAEWTALWKVHLYNLVNSRSNSERVMDGDVFVALDCLEPRQTSLISSAS